VALFGSPCQAIVGIAKPPVCTLFTGATTLPARAGLFQIADLTSSLPLRAARWRIDFTCSKTG